MSRGKPKPKLRDLSQQPLTSVEQDVLLDALVAATPPLVTAILGAVMVEHELETSLRRKLPRKDDKTWLNMLDEQGPFSTFSRKIAAGHAMRIYDDAIFTNLDIIRQIRNAFAHSKRVIDFNHPLVVAQLKRIAIPNFKKKRFAQLRLAESPIESYRSLCILTSLWLLRRENRTYKARLRRRKSRQPRSFYEALVPSLSLANLGSPPEAGQLSPLQSYLQSQSDNPSPPAPQGLLGGLFGLGGELLRKEKK